MLRFRRWGVVDQQFKDRYWANKALDFVDAVERLNTTQEITDLFAKQLSECGFSAYLISGLPRPDIEFGQRMLAHGWAPEWSDLYLKEKWAEHDPVARHCFRSVDPFEWSAAPYDREHEPLAQVIMDRAADFKMRKGFCVPIHSPDGSSAAVSVGGDSPVMTSGVKPAIHIMALYAYQRIRTLLSPPRHARGRLTERERQVLQWVAIGKTSWEIGRIIGTTERTVNAHILAASRKLRANNRTAAAFTALQLHEITL
jgi:LuxR family transcriptional regulator, quorum-sensing system regulator BjaR1